MTNAKAIPADGGGYTFNLTQTIVIDGRKVQITLTPASEQRLTLAQANKLLSQTISLAEEGVIVDF